MGGLGEQYTGENDPGFKGTMGFGQCKGQCMADGQCWGVVHFQGTNACWIRSKAETTKLSCQACRGVPTPSGIATTFTDSCSDDNQRFLTWLPASASAAATTSPSAVTTATTAVTTAPKAVTTSPSAAAAPAAVTT